MVKKSNRKRRVEVTVYLFQPIVAKIAKKKKLKRHKYAKFL